MRDCSYFCCFLHNEADYVQKEQYAWLTFVRTKQWSICISSFTLLGLFSQQKSNHILAGLPCLSSFSVFLSRNSEEQSHKHSQIVWKHQAFVPNTKPLKSQYICLTPASYKRELPTRSLIFLYILQYMLKSLLTNPPHTGPNKKYISRHETARPSQNAHPSYPRCSVHFSPRCPSQRRSNT